MTTCNRNRGILVSRKIPIVGFSGNSECGKDHMAKLVSQRLGLLPVSLADHFKIDGIAKGEWTYEEAYITKPEHARRKMQKRGTEEGRDVYGENVWVDALLDGWMPKWIEEWNANGFVIPDMRFSNEIALVQEVGGFVIRLKAPERFKRSKVYNQSQQTATHRSETLQWEIPDSMFDAVVSNDFGEEQEAEDAVIDLVRQYTYARRDYHPSQRANAIRSGMKL